LFTTIFSESILIAVVGAALGAVLGVAAVRVIAAWAAGILPRLSDVRVDWPILGFALGIATFSSIIGAAPALRSIELATRCAPASGGPQRASAFAHCWPFRRLPLPWCS
jgi:predicted lysophospholipase L1 biosynthesis ABC-type transport system permease subunit